MEDKSHPSTGFGDKEIPAMESPYPMLQRNLLYSSPWKQNLNLLKEQWIMRGIPEEGWGRKVWGMLKN